LKRIVISEEAKADIRAIPQHIALNILTAIHRLAESGAGRVKRLQGIHPPEFRLRVGDWRVFFNLKDENTIEITAVRNRRQAYR